VSSNLLERSGPRPSSTTRQRYSPRARRRARDSGFDLDRVESAPLVAGVAETSSARTSCVVEVDVTALAGCAPSTRLAAVVVAVVRALRTEPAVAAAVRGGLGVTVDTPTGAALLPLPDAGDLNRTALARRIDERSAQAGVAGPGSAAVVTFTVVDVGAWGALFATPVLTAGHLAALGVGAVVERPAVARTADGQPAIAIRSMAHLVLTVDPAHIDDRAAATFLRAVHDGLTDRDDRE
jgi:pyruvate dehydrogenase E2 component (dihydrolipoamide acetyltransferase)